MQGTLLTTRRRIQKTSLWRCIKMKTSFRANLGVALLHLSCNGSWLDNLVLGLYLDTGHGRASLDIPHELQDIFFSSETSLNNRIANHCIWRNMCQLVPNRVQHLFIWLEGVFIPRAAHHSDFVLQTSPNIARNVTRVKQPTRGSMMLWKPTFISSTLTLKITWRPDRLGWDWNGRSHWLVGWLVEGESSLPTNLELREFFFSFLSACLGESMRKLRMPLKSQRERVRATPWSLKEHTGRQFTDDASRKV